MSKFSEWLFGKDVEPLADYRIIKKTLNNGKVSYLPQLLSWDRYEYFYKEGEIIEFDDIDYAQDFITEITGNTVKTRECVYEYFISSDGTVTKTGGNISEVSL